MGWTHTQPARHGLGPQADRTVIDRRLLSQGRAGGPALPVHSLSQKVSKRTVLENERPPGFTASDGRPFLKATSSGSSIYRLFIRSALPAVWRHMWETVLPLSFSGEGAPLPKPQMVFRGGDRGREGSGSGEGQGESALLSDRTLPPASPSSVFISVTCRLSF